MSHTHTHTHSHFHLHTDVCKLPLKRTHTHTHTQRHMHTHTHTHTQTHFVAKARGLIKPPAHQYSGEMNGEMWNIGSALTLMGDPFRPLNYSFQQTLQQF